ncbi:MAG TPA: hypothetical protein VGC06_15760 [Actinomycetes bacterium]
MQDPSQPSSSAAERHQSASAPANGAPPTDRPQPQASPAAGPVPQASPARGGAQPRWGEAGYQPPPAANRQSRLAATWIFGIVGALGLVAAAVVGFAILFAAGHRSQTPPSGAPLPTLPGQGSGTAPGQAPGQGPGATGGSGPQTSGPGVSGRVDTTDYSFKLPDGFQDATAAYKTAHPAEGGVVQSLTQADPAAQPPPEIRISRLPRGFGGGQSLEKIAQTRAGALVQTADDLGALRHSTLGPDPSVEVGLPLQSGGHRTEVIVRHAGRVWEISVIDPGKGETKAQQAWEQTIKPGWQWPA